MLIMASRAAVRLAEKLKPRTDLGMSTAELAAELKVTVQAVSQWLKGDNLPRPELMQRLEKLTGIPMQEWLPPVRPTPTTRPPASTPRPARPSAR